MVDGRDWHDESMERINEQSVRFHPPGEEGVHLHRPSYLFRAGARHHRGLGDHRSAVPLSDTWQLVINTGTTIITFLMVFLIQNTQNRDTEAMQIKLDELIRATAKANNELLDLEEMEEAELDKLRAHYEAMAQKAKEERSKRKG